MKKVSYLDSLIKYKLVSSFLDSKIKQDILGGDDMSLEDTVKAIEAKESAKRAKSKLGGAQRGGLQGGDQGLLQLQGEHSILHQGDVSEVPHQGQDIKTCSKCEIQGHYKDTERCRTQEQPPVESKSPEPQ